MIHTLGKFLIDDDKSDIGYVVYHNRQGHYYHGKHSPDHPDFFHHWMLGSALVLIGHIGGVIERAKEMQEMEAELDFDDEEQSSQQYPF